MPFWRRGSRLFVTRDRPMQIGGMIDAYLSIDGQAAPLNHLWRPWMSLSSAREGRRAARYRLSIERPGLLRALLEPYARYVREAREDDRMTGTTDLLGEAGYPSLEAVVQNPALLHHVLGGCLEEEVFAAILPPVADPANVAGTYAVDTVDSVRLEDERILIEGVCYAF